MLRNYLNVLALLILPLPAAAFKPMSVPLIANEPGNDVWLARVQLEFNNGAQKEIDGPMTDLWGYIMIDGTRKHFMGELSHVVAGEPVISTQSLAVNCTQTIFTQADSSIKLTTTFTAPKLVDELDAISRTINYVTFDGAHSQFVAIN
jgi:hypothetical protein